MGRWAPAFAGATLFRWGDVVSLGRQDDGVGRKDDGVGASSRHSREGGNPFVGRWAPAFAGATLFRWGVRMTGLGRVLVILAKAGI